MKILVFCHEFPPIGGGAGNALYHIAREWVQMRHQVTVVTSCYKDSPIREEIHGIKVHRLKVGRRSQSQARMIEMLIYLTKTIFNVSLYYRHIRPDICVAFMSLPAGGAPLLMRYLFRVPYITELRGGDVPGFNPQQMKRYHSLTKGLLRAIWRNSRSLIANSHSLARLALKTYTKREIQVIPNGVDTNFFIMPNSFQKTDQNYSSLLHLIFVGRFVNSQKNILFLIRAIKRLEGVKLNLVGDGPDLAQIEDEIEALGVRDKVRLIGWASKKELAQLYQESDVYVSASLWEGMSNTVLEAMASGLPAVLSDISEHQEQIIPNKNGFLFNLSGQEEFIQAITKLKRDPELRKRMGAANRQLVKERHDWHWTAKKHLEAFH